MPINDKGEWINPEDSQKEADDYRGYSECWCKRGIHLRQADYEIDLHMCAMCKCEVADPDVFFKFQDGIRTLSK